MKDKMGRIYSADERDYKGIKTWRDREVSET
jgi:hypothetical protein